MKFYLFTCFIVFFTLHVTLGQDTQNNRDKSEIPQLNTESLQLETVVELYPNPVVEHLSVQLKNSQLKNVEFEIYNIIGNKMNFATEMVAHDHYKINVKEFHAGYYLLVVKDQVKRYNKAFKFRKE